MSNLTTKYADDIDYIVRHHEIAQKHARFAIEHAIKSGEALIELKEKCAHGEFTQVVEQCTDIPMRTAQRYMNAARNQLLLDELAPNTLEGLTLTQLAGMHKKGESVEREAATDSKSVYVISDGSGWVKVGEAADPESRLLQLQTGNRMELSLEWHAELPEGFSDTDMHKMLEVASEERSVASREWFRMPAERAVSIVGGHIEKIKAIAFREAA